jgi:hypothetical protein
MVRNNKNNILPSPLSLKAVDAASHHYAALRISGKISRIRC